MNTRMKDGGWRIEKPRPVARAIRYLLSSILAVLLAGPAFANKVTIRDDRTILVDGQPFFPVGLYYPEEEIADASGKLLKDLRDDGFNTLFFHAGAGEETKAKLDRIDAAGLKVQYRTPGGLLGGYEAMTAAVNQFKSHPALLMWEHGDEPTVNNVSFEAGKTGYELIKKLDPDHPVLCVQWPDWKQPDEIKRWGTISDI